MLYNFGLSLYLKERRCIFAVPFNTFVMVSIKTWLETSIVKHEITLIWANEDLDKNYNFIPLVINIFFNNYQQASSSVR